VILLFIQLLFVASEPQTWGPAQPPPVKPDSNPEGEIYAGAKGVPKHREMLTEAISGLRVATYRQGSTTRTAKKCGPHGAEASPKHKAEAPA
jgi:hypothetical protein